MHRASYPPPHSVPQNAPRVPSTKWGDQAQQAIGERLEAATTGRPRQNHNGNAVLERLRGSRRLGCWLSRQSPSPHGDDGQ